MLLEINVWMANQTVTCYTNGTESGFMILGTALSRILLKRTCIDVATKPRAILFHFVHADSRRTTILFHSLGCQSFRQNSSPSSHEQVPAGYARACLLIGVDIGLGLRNFVSNVSHSMSGV